MRILFFNTPGCPFCINARNALAKINEMLPIGSLVAEVNVDMDTRREFLRKTTDMEFPAIMVIANQREKTYNGNRVRPKMVRLVNGVRDEVSNDAYLKRYLRGVQDV